MTTVRKGPEPKPDKKDDSKVDREAEASFPASDPPSYSGGTLGAPESPDRDSK